MTESTRALPSSQEWRRSCSDCWRDRRTGFLIQQCDPTEARGAGLLEQLCICSRAFNEALWVQYSGNPQLRSCLWHFHVIKVRWVGERWNNRPKLSVYLTYNRSQAHLRMVKLNGSKFENKQNTHVFIGSEMRSIAAGMQFSKARA